MVHPGHVLTPAAGILIGLWFIMQFFSQVGSIIGA